MRTNTYKLSDVAAVFNGKTPSQSEQKNEGFPVLKIKDISDNGRFIGYFDSYITIELARELSAKQIRLGDTLILNAAHNADYVGSKVYFAEQSVVGSLATGEWLLIRPNLQRTDPRYINFWIQSSYIRQRIRELVKGIHLYPKDIADLSIHLPLLPEQKRIATILAKADRLRRLRRYALELSSTYLQSVFLEMFGDPVTNPKGWEIIPLGDMLSISPHLGTITPAKESGKQLCVRVGEVGEWDINLGKCKYVSLEEKEFKRFSLQSDDIILARAIGSEAHLGKLSIMGKSSTPVVFDSHLMRIRTDPSRLLTFFLACWLKTDGGRARFMQKTRQTSVQFNINTEQIVSIELPVPPIPLQQKFVKILEKHLRLQAQQREAERQAEHLFQTLLHKAFQGELTLDEDEMMIPEMEVAHQQMPSLADVAEPIDKDAYQMALPLE